MTNMEQHCQASEMIISPWHQGLAELRKSPKMAKLSKIVGMDPCARNKGMYLFRSYSLNLSQVTLFVLNIIWWWWISFEHQTWTWTSFGDATPFEQLFLTKVMESTLLNPSDNTEVECCILDHVSPKASMAIVRNEDPFHQNPMLKNSQWLVSSWEKENSFRFCKW